MPVNLPVKIHLNNTTRRTKLSLDEPAPYERLVGLARSLFSEEADLDNFVIKFPDDEDELCVVSSDMELLEAVNVMSELGRPSLKLFLLPSTNLDDPKVPDAVPAAIDEPDSPKEPLPEAKHESVIDEPDSKKEPLPEVQHEEPLAEIEQPEPEAPEAINVLVEPSPECKVVEPEAKLIVPQSIAAQSTVQLDEKEPDEKDHKDQKRGPLVHLHNKQIILSALMAPLLQNLGRTFHEGWNNALCAMQHHMGKAQVHIDQAWMDMNQQAGQAGQDMRLHFGHAQQHLGVALHDMQQQLKLAQDHVGGSMQHVHQDMQKAHEHIRQVLQDVKVGQSVQQHMTQARQSMEQAWQHMTEFVRSEFKHLGPKTHTGVFCAGCHQGPIIGVRFQCAVCPDVDLCAECEAQDLHPAHHPLLKLRVPTRTDVHHGFACDSCGVTPITGPRYACSECPNYNLCQTCEAKDEHPAEHPLLKIRVAVRYGSRKHIHAGRSHQSQAHHQHQQPQEQVQVEVPTVPTAQPEAKQAQLELLVPRQLENCEAKAAAAEPESPPIQMSPVTSPKATPPKTTPPPPPAAPYSSELHELGNMGFTNRRLNLTLLRRHGGDMSRVCHDLLR